MTNYPAFCTTKTLKSIFDRGVFDAQNNNENIGHRYTSWVAARAYNEGYRNAMEV